MYLHFLGTAGYHPGETRHTSCLMIPEKGIIFDAGTGFFRVKPLIKTKKLHIFLSHLHVDHNIGLTYLLEVLWKTKVKKVTIYADQEQLVYLKKTLFGSLLFPLKFSYTTKPIKDNQKINLSGLKIISRELPHYYPGKLFGFKVIKRKKSLAYITDAQMSEKYLNFIQGVDYLIHECNFPDKYKHLAKKSGHTYTSAIAQLAKKAKVKKLILTHVNARHPGADPVGLEKARQIFKNTILAKDKMKIKIF